MAVASSAFEVSMNKTARNSHSLGSVFHQATKAQQKDPVGCLKWWAVAREDREQKRYAWVLRVAEWYMHSQRAAHLRRDLGTEKEACLQMIASRTILLLGFSSES